GIGNRRVRCRVVGVELARVGVVPAGGHVDAVGGGVGPAGLVAEVTDSARGGQHLAEGVVGGGAGQRGKVGSELANDIGVQVGPQDALRRTGSGADQV